MTAAEGDARGDRDPLLVALPLRLGEVLEELQRVAVEVGIEEAEELAAGDTDAVCEGLEDALREKVALLEPLPQGEDVDDREALTDAVAWREAETESVGHGEALAAGDKEGVCVALEDAQGEKVTIEEPLPQGEEVGDKGALNDAVA